MKKESKIIDSNISNSYINNYMLNSDFDSHLAHINKNIPKEKTSTKSENKYLIQFIILIINHLRN